MIESLPAPPHKAGRDLKNRVILVKSYHLTSIFSKVNLTILANLKNEEGNKHLFLLIKFVDQKKRHSYFEGTEQESTAPPEVFKMGPGKTEFLAINSLIQR